MSEQQSFVPLPQTMPVLSIGLLGVTVPTEWGMCLSTAQWNFMRDMRLEEIERRILAIEAQAIEAHRAETVKQGSVADESAVAESDAPKGDA